MTPDSLALLGVALGFVVLLGIAVARRTGLPDPVALVGVGLAASFLPGAGVVTLPPEVVFLVFLPPLVFRASFLSDPRTLRRLAAPLALLSVGLVLATACAVAVVVDVLVPGLGFAEGLVLGAVVAPTDTVASAAVFSRLGAPRFVVDLVEGESLVNDATALVLFAVALDAVVSGPPGPFEAVGRLVLSITGGVAVGVLAGLLVALVRSRIVDIGLQLLLSLVTPYLAYVVAATLEVSGVLAVVVTGLLLGSRDGGVFGAAARLQATAFWSVLDLLLNAVLFVLLGLQVRLLFRDAPGLDPLDLAAYGAAVVGTVIGLRLLWQLLVPPALYRLRRAAGREVNRRSGAERLVVGWTGMRGAISLAAALAVPLTVRGEPFPGRDLLLFLTIVVVMTTLVLQGTTLPLLLRWTGLGADEQVAEQGRQARVALADVALRRLDALEATGQVPHDAALPLRRLWQQTRAQLDGPLPEDDVDLKALRLDITQAQSRELERLRRDQALPPEVVRELRQELDLQRVRLSRRA